MVAFSFLTVALLRESALRPKRVMTSAGVEPVFSTTLILLKLARVSLFSSLDFLTRLELDKELAAFLMLDVLADLLLDLEQPVSNNSPQARKVNKLFVLVFFKNLPPLFNRVNSLPFYRLKTYLSMRSKAFLIWLLGEARFNRKVVGASKSLPSCQPIP